MAESHQPPPYTHMQHQQHLPPPPYQQQQQQQGMTSWYPSLAAPAPYHHYQVPPNPQWPVSGPPPPPPPPGDQSFVYMQQQQQQQPLQYHHPQGGDFYHHQQPQQYSLTPQPASSQFTYMYGQQDQVWQANGNWGYQPWSYPAQNPSLSQEEVWAAKARAWAASKAAQDESKPAQPGAVTPQTYPDYAHKREPQALDSDDGQPYLIQSEAQEAGSVVQNQTVSNQGQSVPIKPSDQLTQGMTSLDHCAHEITQPLEPLEQNTVSETGQAQLSDRQSVSSSYAGDSTSSFGIDSANTGPPGTDRLDFTSQGTLPPSVSPPFNQQPTSLITQSQASPHVSLPRFTYPEQPSTLGYELHQQHQVPPSYSQPPQQQLTPHSQSLPQIQSPLLQAQPVQQQHPQVQPQPQLQQPQPPQFQSTTMMENVEAEFGLSPASLQSWAPIGGPGMPFPPAIGAGTSQIPVPVFGMSQGLAFPSGSPYIANPGLGPGPGAPVRPPFLPDGFVERPKKAAVPSWLREELMKKKAAGLAGKSSGMLLSDESNRVNGGEPATPLNQRLGISDRVRSKTPGLSDDEEDNHEEELEAARNAAINQEIKRLLTDVLLKVTGDLFEEIAQEVLDEDDDEILQEKLSMNGQERTHRVTTSPVPAPASGRVLVSSQKVPAATDDVKDSEDSGSGAGNVLGLGDYGSDDDNTRGTEEGDWEDLDNTNQAQLTKDASPHEVIEKYNGSTEKHVDFDNDDTYQRRSSAKRRENDMEDYHVRRHEQEGGKKRMREDESWQTSTSVKGYPVDTSNGKTNSSGHTEGATLEGEVDLPKGEPYRYSAASSKDNQASREAHSTKHDDKDKPPLGKDSHGGSSKSGWDKTRVKEITNEALNDRKLSELPPKDKKKEERTLDDELRDREIKDQKLPNIHPKEKKRDDRTKDLLDTSRKEKKVEERNRDSARRKGNDVQRSERGSHAGERDSSRGRRKEKVRDRAKSRDKDYHQDSRRNDKKGSKRIDSQEKRARRRSSSSSSGPSRSSSPYSSDNSRGRSHALRAGRHRSSLTSPGKSRKRRVSRSRSRSPSRSPHARHSHRRNDPSPFHEKSRRSPSHSPIHRRRHS